MLLSNTNGGLCRELNLLRLMICAIRLQNCEENSCIKEVHRILRNILFLPILSNKAYCGNIT